MNEINLTPHENKDKHIIQWEEKLCPEGALIIPFIEKNKWKEKYTTPEIMGAFYKKDRSMEGPKIHFQKSHGKSEKLGVFSSNRG